MTSVNQAVQRAMRSNPYHQMAREGLAKLDMLCSKVDQAVQDQREIAARRHLQDYTYTGVDQDSSIQYPGVAGTFASYQVPQNMGMCIMRIAAYSEPEDILRFYRGTPAPQNIIERLVTQADGFVITSISNKLYITPGTRIVIQSSKGATAFHVNFEIERMPLYMKAMSSNEIENELAGTPVTTGPDAPWPAVGELVEPQVERHMNPISEPPDEQPDVNQQDAQRQLIPDANAHLPGAHV